MLFADLLSTSCYIFNVFFYSLCVITEAESSCDSQCMYTPIQCFGDAYFSVSDLSWRDLWEAVIIMIFSFSRVIWLCV